MKTIDQIVAEELARQAAGKWHFKAGEPPHHYAYVMVGGLPCLDCDGFVVWNDSNHDHAHCTECGACSDPDHTVEA